MLSPRCNECWQLNSGSSGSVKPSMYIWKFLVHILLKFSLKDVELNLANMWNECNCMVVWTSFGIALLWGWNENWPSLVLWPLLSFSNLLAYWVQHFNSIIFRILSSSARILSPSLPLLMLMLPMIRLTSPSRMSSSRWVTTPLWLSWLLRSLLYSFEYSCHLNPFCFF